MRGSRLSGKGCGGDGCGVPRLRGRSRRQGTRWHGSCGRPPQMPRILQGRGPEIGRHGRLPADLARAAPGSGWWNWDSWRSRSVAKETVELASASPPSSWAERVPRPRWRRQRAAGGALASPLHAAATSARRQGGSGRGCAAPEGGDAGPAGAVLDGAASGGAVLGGVALGGVTPGWIQVRSRRRRAAASVCRRAVRRPADVASEPVSTRHDSAERDAAEHSTAERGAIEHGAGRSGVAPLVRSAAAAAALLAAALSSLLSGAGTPSAPPAGTLPPPPSAPPPSPPTTKVVKLTQTPPSLSPPTAPPTVPVPPATPPTAPPGRPANVVRPIRPPPLQYPRRCGGRERAAPRATASLAASTALSAVAATAVAATALAGSTAIRAAAAAAAQPDRAIYRGGPDRPEGAFGRGRQVAGAGVARRGSGAGSRGRASQDVSSLVVAARIRLQRHRVARHAVYRLGGSTQVERRSRTAARAALQQDYTGTYPPFSPYQQKIRLGIQAHEKGDRAEEKRLFREVLDILHAESKNKSTGVTGMIDVPDPPAGNPSDRHLEGLISTLLSD